MKQDAVAAAATRVALLARPGTACDRLQAALGDAGADVVLVSDPAQTDAAGVRAAGAQAILIALAKAAQSADSVSGQGTLDVLRYGRLLQARQLVGVRGAGMAFDGLYYVKSVTHSIKPGQYKQNFSLSRNGLVSSVPKVVA